MLDVKLGSSVFSKVTPCKSTLFPKFKSKPNF